MKNFKKLSREEMKKVVGGLGRCMIECWNEGATQNYSYPVDSCSSAPMPWCGDSWSGSCVCQGT